MSGDEQRVRTEAGWIGVEISRSRVRTPGKAGYGLYRVRGLTLPMYPTPGNSDPWSPVRTEWTAYAFTLAVIGAAVRNSIGQGTPARPMALRLVEDATAGKTGVGGYAGGVTVPTRWTSAYTGKRNLGELAVGSTEMAGRPVGEGSTVRSRQRASNAAFQVEHLERRAYGLEKRHAAKLQRNGRQPECGSC